MLNAAGPLQWKGGDNDFWGEYLVAYARDRVSKFRLFTDQGRFVIDVYWIEQLPESVPYQELQEHIERDVLPAVKARDLQPHSGWE